MTKHRYVEEELDFLRKFAYGHSYKEITDAINAEFGLSLGVNKIRACLKNHKITTGGQEGLKKGIFRQIRGSISLQWEEWQKRSSKKGISRRTISQSEQ